MAIRMIRMYFVMDSYPNSSGVLGTCVKLMKAQIPLRTAGMIRHLIIGKSKKWEKLCVIGENQVHGNTVG